MTYLESIREALKYCLANDEKVILLGEDICDPYGGAFKVTKGLSTEFPERVINTPLSEPALTGISTGMALREMHPILEIMFGDFLTLCADQLINHASKFRWMYNNSVRVPMVIRLPMGGYRGYGPTHSQTTERLLFGFPNTTIIAPSHFQNAGYLLKKSIDRDEITIFIEHKLLYAQEIIDSNKEFYQGFKIVRKDCDSFETVILSSCEEDETPMITIITYGGMSPMTFSAARKALLENEVTCEIIIPSLIKPLKADIMKESIKKSGRALVVEEGHYSWGWGAEVVANLSESCFRYLKAPIERVAAKNYPIPCSRTLEKEILPNEGEIVEKILKISQA